MGFVFLTLSLIGSNNEPVADTATARMIKSGMTRAEVEKLVGEPLHGYQRLGDALADNVTAIYRTPLLNRVHYVQGRVVRVTPEPGVQIGQIP